MGVDDQVSKQQLEKQGEDVSSAVVSPGGSGTSRRAFLKKSGRRAMYVAPIVLSLSASVKAAVSGFDSTCGDAGSPCDVDGDCCGVLTCTGMMCA